MPLHIIETLDDPRLDVFARLTDTQLRSRLEPERAVCIAESKKVIERAFDGGYRPVSLLMEEKFVDDMAPLIARMEQANPELTVFVAPHDELERLTGYEVTRGALGAFRRPAYAPLDEVLEDARLIGVLEGITNHTNVGAIFRSAAALGVDALLISSDCYDPLYRRAARVSMGTVFQVPWTRLDGGRDAVDSMAAGLETLQAKGFICAAMALEDDSVTLDDLAATVESRPDAKVAMVFGTEGDGLNQRTIHSCPVTVRIPMHHGVDSLNVAAASAVAFYEMRRAVDRATGTAPLH